uniref:Myelin basic protein n=1 Tax=Corticoviridae sp. TaxID=2832474 RepID=A0A8D9UHG2_9VIRU|nr:MAG TPA: myelin basic protein [Corticoviridae sp.]
MSNAVGLKKTIYNALLHGFASFTSPQTPTISQR